jgi:hypothetical protein
MMKYAHMRSARVLALAALATSMMLGSKILPPMAVAT